MFVALLLSFLAVLFHLPPLSVFAILLPLTLSFCFVCRFTSPSRFPFVSAALCFHFFSFAPRSVSVPVKAQINSAETGSGVAARLRGFPSRFSARPGRRSAISTSHFLSSSGPQRKINSNDSWDLTLEGKFSSLLAADKASFHVPLSAPMAPTSNPALLSRGGFGKTVGTYMQAAMATGSPGHV